MSVVGLGLKAASFAARLSPAGAAFKTVPRSIWIALAIVAVVAAGLVWHHREVKATIANAQAEQKTADDRAYTAQALYVARQAAALRARTERLEATINTKWRTIHDQEIRDHAAAASALLLRGPGAAAAVDCRPVGHSAAAVAADRHDQTAAAGAAPGSEVHPGDGSALQSGDAAIVSWKWLVTVVQEHDDLLSDVNTIESDHAEQNEAWDQMRAAKLKPAKP